MTVVNARDVVYKSGDLYQPKEVVFTESKLLTLREAFLHAMEICNC
jgi:hypothetical protein